VVLTDLVGYWTHRWHHTTDLWRLHRVHHSTEHVDWLASVRAHPLNEVVQRVPPAILLVLLGFDLRIVAGVAPALAIYALFLHADVPWRYGPLRYAIASPAFHRWHHALLVPGMPPVGCNFAGLLPLWDLLFGTYFVPDHPPAAFGVEDGPAPAGFWGQLLLRR
jgi:sterol desaturase/sphingolipid hydroxylase (fatty acid hydroxylase superfamily)